MGAALVAWFGVHGESDRLTSSCWRGVDSGCAKLASPSKYLSDRTVTEFIRSQIVMTKRNGVEQIRWVCYVNSGKCT